ncbi:MAG TPA: hypothetical protein EYP08_07365, partial [Pyrodictiaceae archaeon]|nr:hypothetical protein [Pyrodictiaceae archaeon]
MNKYPYPFLKVYVYAAKRIKDKTKHARAKPSNTAKHVLGQAVVAAIDRRAKTHVRMLNLLKTSLSA